MLSFWKVEIHDLLRHCAKSMQVIITPQEQQEAHQAECVGLKQQEGE